MKLIFIVKGFIFYDFWIYMMITHSYLILIPKFHTWYPGYHLKSMEILVKFGIYVHGVAGRRSISRYSCCAAMGEYTHFLEGNKQGISGSNLI